MVDIPGTTLDKDTAAHLKKYGIRSVCLFGKNVESPEQLRQLCSDLREVLGEHALIALDHEGGAIIRPNFWPFPPSAMALGAANDPALTEEMNAVLARQLRSVGINWNFAPVLDVNVNSANPVIGDRAFGADPAQVSTHGRAALAGHAREGVAACVKHFPGHGDTHQDSHHNLPTVSKTRAELDELELRPFRELLPQTPAVMTAHIVFDALDAAHPATLSKPILTDLLRDEWGYDGVIVTDSMGMKAIDDNYGRGEAGVMALKAGADLVMALGNRAAQVATLDAIEAAMLGIPDVPGKVGRLEALAAQYPSQADPAIDTEADRPAIAAAWAKALTGYRQPKVPAPPRSTVVLLAHRLPQRENVSEAATAGETLAYELAQVYHIKYVPFERPDDIPWEQVRGLGFPVILATTFRHRQPGLKGVQPDLHLALYNPYIALDVDAPAVLSYGFRPEARRALIGWLSGEVELNGQLPFEE